MYVKTVPLILLGTLTGCASSRDIAIIPHADGHGSFSIMLLNLHHYAPFHTVTIRACAEARRFFA